MKTETELLQEAIGKLPDPSECSSDFIMVPVCKYDLAPKPYFTEDTGKPDTLDSHIICFQFYKHKSKEWVLHSKN